MSTSQQRTQGEVPVGKTAPTAAQGGQPEQARRGSESGMTGIVEQGRGQVTGQQGRGWGGDPFARRDPFESALDFPVAGLSNALMPFGGFGLSPFGGLGGGSLLGGFPGMGGGLLADPFAGFGGSQLMAPMREMDRMLSQVGSFTPSMKLDILENADNFDLRLDMPGVEEKDVKIEVDEARRIVHVNVNKDESKETDDTDVFGRRVHRSERFTGSGYRSIRLPANADINAVKANLQNGLLTIEVKKSERTPGFKNIPLGGQQASLQDVPQQSTTQGATQGARR